MAHADYYVGALTSGLASVVETLRIALYEKSQYTIADATQYDMGNRVRRSAKISKPRAHPAVKHVTDCSCTWSKSRAVGFQYLLKYPAQALVRPCNVVPGVHEASLRKLDGPFSSSVPM